MAAEASAPRKLPKKPEDSQGSAGKAPDGIRAWAPYSPDPERPWNLARAGHLLRRAAFGAFWSELSRALEEGPERAVGRLLAPEADVEGFHRAEDGLEASAMQSDSTDSLRGWWLRRMLRTPHPLLEKMTLFWHGFFGVSNARVKDSLLMSRHVRHLRRHALGSFEEMLLGIAGDPATLVALGAAANRKARPGEHLARIFLQEYTVGPGRFGEEDVLGLARSFTGWFVLRGELRYFAREFDPGTRTILGREGAFDAEGAVRVLLRDPATPRHVVRELYRWLISETEDPPEDLLAPLAEAFSRDYRIGSVVEKMLRSSLFFSREAYRRRVKGPVEFALGIVKALEGDCRAAALGAALASLGQDLYRPPTVKGWTGGARWLQWSSLTGRANLAWALLHEEGNGLDPLAVARKHGHEGAEPAAAFLSSLLLADDLEDGPRAATLDALKGEEAGAPGDASGKLRLFTHLITTSPEFQLA